MPAAAREVMREWQSATHRRRLIRQQEDDEIAQRAVYVHLKGLHVTDEWLENLQGLKHVEVLSIRSHNVSDKGLMHLKALPHLMNLNLVNANVTDAGLEELREALPSLKLVSSRVPRSDPH